MRFSSVKSVFATLSLVTLVSLAAPSAEARPAKPRGAAGIVNTVRMLVSRFIGGVTANGGTTIPIPGEPAPVNTEETTPPLPNPYVADQQ